ENSHVCQGVESPARIRLPCQGKETLELIAESSICSETPSKVHSVDRLSLPFNSGFKAGEIYCRKVGKQEAEEVYKTSSTVPGDLNCDSPSPEVEILSQDEKEAVCRGKRNTTCPCGLIFDTVNQLKFHRRVSSDVRCKRQQTKKNGGGI
ncbi:hypothetical protein, partial [Sansalvadorimonas verongulae]|uniref:hypothetical protein n=1 Tax=Sansalvadorimonas verongulae TaxID=2172824 RepID=UPI001E39DC28